MSRVIELDSNVTVSSLAEHLELPSTSLVAELFKNGVMVTLNEKIDFDTATILISELGLDVELKQKVEETISNRPTKERENANLTERPPVVAVMGHVDHGKTSLLDKIRGGNVADDEAGGITQHISAYQIDKGDRKITFLDTPGHEAFAAIREHGAVLTDVAIIVVAADDGIKPQTLEAIRFAKKAGVKLIIAANKMDKPGANIEKLKQQLSEQELLPEDWGGDTIIVPVSAKTGEGIDKLLDMVLLVADVEELTADSAGAAAGLVIEAQMKQGMGPIAVALVEQGVLNKGDILVSGGAYGKARIMRDSNGEEITTAGPSTPVMISGFKSLPEFGQEFHVVKTEKEAKKIASEFEQSARTKSTGMTSTELLRIINKRNAVEEFNVLVKADVKGSLASVVDGIKSIDNEEIATRIVGSGVGSVGENDIRTAAASNAVIYGFNIQIPVNIKRQAVQQDVKIKVYTIIYELLDDVKQELETRLSPETITHEIGRLKVKGIFNTTKTEVICGGEVTKGPLKLPARAKVMRAKKQIADVEVTNLKRGPQDTHEVPEGEMCGMNLKTESKLTLEEGDILDLYSVEIKERKL